VQEVRIQISGEQCIKASQSLEMKNKNDKYKPYNCFLGAIDIVNLFISWSLAVVELLNLHD
jgi:hypothetical protein